MVLSTSQQVALAFTGVLFMFVVLPRLYGFGSGTAAKDAKLDSRYSRKGGNIQLVLGHSEVHFALVIARKQKNNKTECIKCYGEMSRLLHILCVFIPYLYIYLFLHVMRSSLVIGHGLFSVHTLFLMNSQWCTWCVIGGDLYTHVWRLLMNYVLPSQSTHALLLAAHLHIHAVIHHHLCVSTILQNFS